MTGVHPGMTLAEREAARALVLKDRVEAARREAAFSHRTIACAWQDRHNACVGEQEGNSGCLCSCHDPAPATEDRTEVSRES